MNILTILKLFATLFEKWNEYMQRKKIEGEIIAESEKAANEQILIANTARNDALLLPVDEDEFNRDTKKDNSL